MVKSITRCARCGSSLTEVFAVATILGIIAIILVPKMVSSRDASQEQAHQRNVEIINSAVEQFYINENCWPENDLSDIGADRNYFPQGLPVNPMDGSTYGLDPTTHRVQ